MGALTGLGGLAMVRRVGARGSAFGLSSPLALQTALDLSVTLPVSCICGHFGRLCRPFVRTVCWNVCLLFVRSRFAKMVNLEASRYPFRIFLLVECVQGDHAHEMRC